MQATQESQRLCTKVEIVLREQLSVVQEETTQKLGVVAKELTQCFEGEMSSVHCEVVTMQQNEIQALLQEIEHLKLQEETTICNMETARTTSVTELWSTIVGLRSKVVVERACRENEE